MISDNVMLTTEQFYWIKYGIAVLQALFMSCQTSSGCFDSRSLQVVSKEALSL